MKDQMADTFTTIRNKVKKQIAYGIVDAVEGRTYRGRLDDGTEYEVTIDELVIPEIELDIEWES